MKKIGVLAVTVTAVLIAVESAQAANVRVVIDSGMCGENVAYECWKYKFDPTIYLDCWVTQSPGDRCIYSYATRNAPPWVAYRSSVDYVSVTGVLEAGSYSFYGFTACKQFTVSDSMRVIGPYAFSQCTNVAQFNVPRDVVLIARGAFQNDKGLTMVSFGQNLRSISSNAFTRCNLQRLELPDRLRSVGKSAFSYNRHLRFARFGQADVYVGDETFNGCTALSTLARDGHVTFGQNVFRGCGISGF